MVRFHAIEDVRREDIRLKLDQETENFISFDFWHNKDSKMIEQTTNLTETVPEKQEPKPADVKLRLLAMQLSGDYPMLEQQYLARKLNRSNGAISRALKGELPILLSRIVRHLDWLERKALRKRVA